MNKKGIIPVFIIITTVLTILISIGYAALNTNLNVSGEAFIRAKDNVRISRIDLSDAANDGYETYNPEYSKRTTKIYATLPKDDSSVTYTVKVTNSTGVKYKVDSIEVDNTNPNVSCTPNIEVDSILEDGVTEFTITANYENGMSQDTNLDACEIKYEFSPLDKTPPVLSIQLVKDNGSAKTIKITATDEVDGSGLSPDNIYKYYLSTSSTEPTGGQWKEYTNNVEFEISGDLEVKYLWIYPVKDRAGNINDGKADINTAYVAKTYVFIDNSPTLYNVIAKEALTDGVAKLYTGKHNDAYDESGTKKIFHFYGADDSKGAEVLTKNNVILGGFCWQMMRTTDTGGVKLIYNGVPSEVDGKKVCTNSGADTTIGSSAFTSAYDSPAYAGYMYNTVYQDKTRSMTSTDVYKYANSFTYSNGTYKLSSDAISIDVTNSTEKTKLNNAHYTCFNTTGECETIYNINYIDSNNLMYYIELQNGKSLEDALDEMLYADDVNKTNSAIKNVIDTWYANNMTDYTKYLEDTVFCNNRSISDYGGWNTNGGKVTVGVIKFNGFDDIYDIYCPNVTDRFSVGNSKAKLAYPVGLASLGEMLIMGNSNARKTGANAWLMSIDSFNYTYISYIRHRLLEEAGTLYSAAQSTRVFYVRPSVSAAQGTRYVSGTGSTTDPYIVDLNAPTVVQETIIDGEREKTIRITASDDYGLSSENKYKYYLSTSKTELAGGEWKDYTNGEIFSITGENETRYLWIYPVMDNAGNINGDKTDINTPYMLMPLTFRDKLYLYNVLQKEYASGSGLSKLYEGQHSDSYNETGTQNIYHFYGADDTAATSILSKNNVLFAGFCWQMIRTTDTGGTKLIYNGVPKVVDGKKVCTNSGTEQQIGTSRFNNDSYGKPMLVGYMYGSDTTDFTINTNDSIIKTYIDDWYANNMTNYAKYLEDTVFCNDRNVTRTKRSEIWWTNYESNVTDLYCTNVTDRFSISNSGAKLTYPVGMLSAPEFNILGNNNLRMTGTDYWTLSPYYYFEDSSSAFVNSVSTSGNLSIGGIEESADIYGVRPSLSIASNVEYTAGTGSATDPYMIGLSLSHKTLTDGEREKTVKITVSSSSALSSQNKYQYYLSTSETSLSGGEWKNYTLGEEFTLTGSNETRYLWIYPIMDSAGNINDGKTSISEPYCIATYKFASTYTVTYVGNKFSTISKVENGITVTYDPDTSILTLNGTQGSKQNLDFMIASQSFSEGEEYKITLDYVSGSLTNVSSCAFATEASTSTGAAVSTRNYADTSLPTSGSRSSILKITSVGASEGTHLFSWIYISTDSGGTTFTNYKIKVNITKVDTKTVKYNETYGTLGDTPTRYGNTFAGWYTEEFSGTQVTSSTTMSKESDHNIYAHWTPNNYTLTINPNGGTYNSSTSNTTITIQYRKTQTIANPTRTGYIFSGWTVSGKDSNMSGTTFTMGGANTTLTANWTLASYTLTINPNGGTYNGSTSNTTMTIQYGKTQTIANPTKSGYVFSGWTVSGTGSKISGTTFTMGSANATLKANWATIETVSLSYTGAAQYYTAPVTGNYEITLYGAKGGAGGLGLCSGGSGGAGGNGGYVKATVKLTQGQTYTVWVGGKGTDSSYGNTQEGTGGLSDGVTGGTGSNVSGGGGGGGGSSYIALGSTVYLRANGGGGGGGGADGGWYRYSSGTTTCGGCGSRNMGAAGARGGNGGGGTLGGSGAANTCQASGSAGAAGTYYANTTYSTVTASGSTGTGNGSASIKYVP